MVNIHVIIEGMKAIYNFIFNINHMLNIFVNDFVFHES